MKKQSCAVAIPVYKEDMSEYESVSFKRCLDILDSYDVFLVSPADLRIDLYYKMNDRVRASRFPQHYFQDIQGYNRLMLSIEFYERFLEYKYVLIHQLDAFIFSSHLGEWCDKGYDYVGAPWIDNPAIEMLATNGSRIRRALPAWAKRLNRSVGNGGFSLRKVSSFRRFLKVFGWRASGWSFNEDFFWAFYASSYYPLFRIPAFEVALTFAFEAQPRKCYELNKYHLPFGCHAWQKYDPEFWRPIFCNLGYEI